MRFASVGASFTLAMVIAAGCGSTSTPSNTGGGSQGGGGAASSSSSSGSVSSSSSSSSSSSGSTGCADGAQQCKNGVHQVCQNGVFADMPCVAGQGCDPASGGCVDCLCAPGTAAPVCADAMNASVCDASCLTYAPSPCGINQACQNGQCLDQICVPGTLHCKDAGTTEVCNATGTGYDPGSSCAAKEQCSGSAGCLSLCAAFAASPSSVGCSFFALNMDNYDESDVDAVTIGNTSSTLTAVVTVYSSYNGTEAVIQSNIQVPPLTEYTVNLPNSANDYIHGVSKLRKGGAFRVESDIPIIAYQHSPLTPYYTNDASCLLPEATLGNHYFVPSYVDALGSYPSYFDVIATQNNTQVTVTVPQATAAGTGVPALSAGGTTTVTMNRYDTLHVINAPGGSAATRDVMGTEVLATAPVAVFGAVECAQIPAGYTYCDHIEEQAIPVRSWGQTYVGAHVPKRSNSERYYWRVMAYQDGTTINTNPQQTGFPKTLNKGQFYEFYAQAGTTVDSGSFILTGDKPFAAFQYITGQDAFGAGTGDPAMITAVPVEQFLSRYVVLTPIGYSKDYIQIIRTTAADVFVDGNMVPASSYYTLGAYTVADFQVAAGPHSLTSSSPFGIVGAGYTSATSYGYPGGLALNNIAPN